MNKAQRYFQEQHYHGRAKPIPMVELERILGLPLMHEFDEDDADVFSVERMRPEAYAEGLRISPTQTAMVRAYTDFGGGFFPVGTGFGKSLACFLIANEAFKAGLRKILLLIPANASHQTAVQQLPFAKKMVPLEVAVYMTAGHSAEKRLSMCRSHGAGLYIVNYSHISARNGLELLAVLEPELVIADESHYLANPRSGMGKKVYHLLDETGPQFVCMSGTIAKKRLKQFQPLILRALKERAPLPKQANVLDSWGVYLDSHATGDLPEGFPKSLEPLVLWARDNYPDKKFEPTTSDLREAFQLRLHSAPGVVATKGESVGTALYIQNEPVPDLDKTTGWDKAKELITKVEKEMVTPDGDVIEHPMLTYKWRYELSAGFYNSLQWPTTEHLLRYKMAQTAEEAAERLERSQQYHAALNTYHGLLGKFLKKAPMGLDTPMDVGRSISKYQDRYVPTEVVEAWQAKEELDFEGRIERTAQVVMLSDGKINAALNWAAARKGGCIIWWWNRGLGRRLAEVGMGMGLPILYCPAGAEANEAIIEHANADKIVVASIFAHGTAKNLQHFGDQYFVQFPRDSAHAEQTISRTHRQGQQRDELIVTTNLTTDFDHENYAAMLCDAVFAQTTLGQRQRVVFATYDPLPRVFSPEFLRAKGFRNNDLTPEQKLMMRDKFGLYLDEKSPHARAA